VQFPLPIYFAVPVAAVLRKNRPRAYETGGLGGAAGVHDPRAHGTRSGASGGDIGCTALQVAPAPHRSSPPPAAQLPHQSRAAVRTVAGGTAGSRARQPVRRRRVWRGPPTSLPAFSCRPTPALEQGGGAGGGGRDGGIPGAGGACSGGMSGARIAHRPPLPPNSHIRAGRRCGRQRAERRDGRTPVASGRIRVWSGGVARVGFWCG
jgi:hypothetical protein